MFPRRGQRQGEGRGEREKKCPGPFEKRRPAIASATVNPKQPGLLFGLEFQKSPVAEANRAGGAFAPVEFSGAQVALLRSLILR